MSKSSASSVLLLCSGCQQGFCTPCFLEKKKPDFLNIEGKMSFSTLELSACTEKPLRPPAICPLEWAAGKVLPPAWISLVWVREAFVHHALSRLPSALQETGMVIYAGVSQGFFCVRGGMNSCFGCCCRGFRGLFFPSSAQDAVNVLRKKGFS